MAIAICQIVEEILDKLSGVYDISESVGIEQVQTAKHPLHLDKH